MGNELAEPSCPQWVDTAGFTNPSQQWCTCSWNFHTVRGGAVRGDNRFRPRKIGVVDIRKAFCSEDGIVYSPGASGFTNPSESAISRWGWVSTTCGAVSTRRTTVLRSRPRFVGVVRVCGRISDPGMGPSRPGGAGCWLYESQVGVSTPCGAVLTRGTTMFVSSTLKL